VIYVLQLN